MDLEDIWKASVFPIVLALLLNLLLALGFMGFTYLFSGSGSSMGYIAFFSIIAVTYLLNLLVYVYAGYRAGKKYRMSALGGGIVAALSFAVAHTIITIIGVLISLAFYSGIFLLGSASDVGLMAGMAGLLGVMSLVISGFVYFAALISGLLINFIAGAIAAYFVTKRWT
jgi:hypothetical protein